MNNWKLTVNNKYLTDNNKLVQRFVFIIIDNAI